MARWKNYRTSNCLINFVILYFSVYHYTISEEVQRIQDGVLGLSTFRNQLNELIRKERYVAIQELERATSNVTAVHFDMRKGIWSISCCNSKRETFNF